MVDISRHRAHPLLQTWHRSFAAMGCLHTSPVHKVFVPRARWCLIAVSHQVQRHCTTVGTEGPLARNVHSLSLGFVDLAELWFSDRLRCEVLEHAPPPAFIFNTSPITPYLSE